MSQALEGRDGPGVAWAYDSDGLYWVNNLTLIFKNATGRAPSEVWRNQFHRTLGMSANFSWSNADNVWAWGSEGTCRDYARIGQLLLNKGKWPRAGADAVQL